MAAGVLDMAERLWTGQAAIEDYHPLAFDAPLEEIGPGVAFFASFSNVSAFTTDEGLVLVDTGAPFAAKRVHEQVRRWSPAPLHTAVFSHGHVDHVFGMGAFEEEAQQRSWPAPKVVAHEALPRRFDRYLLTAGYNEIVNRRQFMAPEFRWPREYRYPDVTYSRRLDLEVGGTTLELHHARGETDDHTWTWLPRQRVLCCGDLFIWASPNAGNPQKVQRYPAEWAAALREMASLGAEVLLPGHGLPIVGGERVAQALGDTAELLESLHDQVVELMNAGARLDQVLCEVRAPAHLLERPYLRPIYDEPEFVVRNLWRLYGGWYDGNPANLKPAPEAALAAEVAQLAGGPDRLAARARQLAEQGELRLAGHLAELAWLAAPNDPDTRRARHEVFGVRAATEASTMARGIFAWAAAEASGDEEPR